MILWPSWNKTPIRLFEGLLGKKPGTGESFQVHYAANRSKRGGKVTPRIGYSLIMQPQHKFSLLRSVLHAFGLPPEDVDNIVNRIVNLLSGGGGKNTNLHDFPYHLRDEFLSPAEQSFYLVLKHVVTDRAIICTKVALGDLFYVKSSDRSKFRTLTNKIDRKHVDFLLCDPKTVCPLVGIELDDRSHQRGDRKDRDEFVEMVYKAAKLPLLRIPAQRAYTTSELVSLLSPLISLNSVDTPSQSVIPEKGNPAPLCPKCGREMVLRTAKKGSSQGAQFWSCPDYPNCRGVLPYVSINSSPLVLDKEVL